ncbi:PH domain protein, putative (macronuclear) [Tetrahymena thermophila SB210]|uniref:PH domain protein, putative n=1 Tax=Tetrahymena thermophila (strain SB210) TaxID=312017 RepID=Q23NK5_TETTS|nr:PH domain protein, putative [Tetrahymena thermophila SB210]EAR98069.2 PH domain protein, putative [Tetrahymena thermophila SB210]|eukprot:XP_001018314.2 PH domain protein, putative [Tetrahymena thermophila SB210]
MFKFAPLNWASSFLLSNILQPYFQGFDEKQVSLGLWQGEIELNNLELKPDVLVMLDIDLEILNNKIEKVTIKIPWKNLRTEPIVVSIEGFCLSLKQCYQQNEKEATENLQKLQKLKEIALQKFDKELQDRKNQQKNKEKGEKQGFFMSKLKDMLNNLQVRLKNAKFSYTRQINDFEIAKLGLHVSEVVLQQMNEKKLVQNTLELGYVFKQISITGLQVYFDFYEQSQFEYLNLKKKESKEFLDESVLHLQDKSIFKEKDFFSEDIQIVKDFNIQCILKMKFQDGLELDLGVSTSKIILVLQQQQIRMLIKLINDFKWYRRDRPLISPMKEIFIKEDPEQQKQTRKQRQEKQMFKKGVVQWWQYLIKRIREENRINQKIKFRHIDRIINDEVYKRLYTATQIMSKPLPKKKKDFIKRYEYDNSLAQIILIRQFALEKISQMTEGLQSDDKSVQNACLEWFRKFDQSIQLNSIKRISNDISSKKSIYSGEVKGSKKHIILNLKIDSIEINVNENNMISDIKNLYNQVLLFKKELKKYPKLQKQVLNHLTKNFLSELSHTKNHQQRSQLIQQNFQNSVNQIDLNNFIENLSQNEEEFISFNQQDMKSEYFKNNKQSPLKKQGKNQEKQNEYLLRISIDTLRVQIDQQQNQKVIKFQFRELEGIDLHTKNIHYSRFIYIPNGVKLFINSLVVKKFIKADKSEEYENVVHNHIDFQVDSIDFIFTKPFFERCRALHQLIIFNADKIFEAQKNLNQKLQKILFEKILQTQPKDSSKSNISVNMGRINIYFPINYQIRSDIFLIQLKNLKSYKREHDSLLVLQQNDAYSYHTENHNKSENSKEMITFFTSVDSLRLMFVKSYDWEEYENVFLVNYAKLNQSTKSNSMKESTKDQSNNFTNNNFQMPQKNININLNNNQQYSQNNEKLKNHKPYVSILETLQIVVRIDQEDSEMQFDNFTQQTATATIKDYKNVIYPHSFKISLDLPFLIFNFDLKQIHILNYLATKWLIQGVNLFQAIKNQTLIGYDQKTNLYNHEKKLRKSNIFDKRESEQERYFNSQYGYNNSNGFLQTEYQDYANNYDIQQDRIIDLLENFIVLRVKVNLEGLMFNLAINSQEAFQNNNIPQAATQSFHSNDLFAFYLKNIKFIFIEKVQEQNLNLTIETIVLEQKNCYDIQLKDPLANLSSKLLSQSDYAKLYANQYIEKNNIQTKVLDQLNEEDFNENAQQKQNLNCYNFHAHNQQLSGATVMGNVNDNLNIKQAKYQDLFDEIDTAKGFNHDLNEEIEDLKAIGEGLSVIQENEVHVNNQHQYQQEVMQEKVKDFVIEQKETKNKNQENIKNYLNDGIYTKLQDYQTLSSKRCSYCFQNGKNSCGLILNFMNYPSNSNNQSNPNNTKDHLFSTINFSQTPNKNSKLGTTVFHTNTNSKLNQEREEYNEPDLRLSFKVFRNALRKQLSEENQKQFSEIDIQLKQTIFTMDPAMIQQIKLILDSVSVFTKINIENFQQYMKWMGFWPDFYQEEHEVFLEQETIKQSHPDASNEIPSTNICAKTDGITIIFVHKKENIFLMNLEKFGFQMRSFQLLTKVEFFSQNVSFFETHDKIGAHSTVIESLKHEDPNTLKGEFIIYKNEQLASIQKFKTYLGIKLYGVKVIFLKRSTYEIQLYIRAHILQALQKQLSAKDEEMINKKFKKRILKYFKLPILEEHNQTVKNEKESQSFQHHHQNQQQSSIFNNSKLNTEDQANDENKGSTFRLELLILDSQAIGFRNSLSNDAIYLHFQKLGMWTTGAWGMDEGELILTELLQNEITKGGNDLEFQEVTSNEQQQMQDWQKAMKLVDQVNEVIFEKEFEGQMSQNNEDDQACQSNTNRSRSHTIASDFNQTTKNYLENQTPEASHSMTFSESQQSDQSIINYESLILIKIKGIQIRTKEGKENSDLVAVDPGKDWSIVLKILTDERFNEENPGMNQDRNPLKIDIRINALNLYIWDHDYKTICKFFQENLGEQPQTVIPSGTTDLKNEETWCFIDIRLNKAQAKIFQGDRGEYIKYYHSNYCNKNLQRDINSIYCRCKDNAINNNEASIGELEIKDLIYKFYMQEYGGKTMKLFVGHINLDDNRKNSKINGRKVLYDLNLQEFNIFEELSTFDQNVDDNQNIIFQNIDENNQDIDNNSQSDEMEIYENFDQIDENEGQKEEENSGTEQSNLENEQSKDSKQDKKQEIKKKDKQNHHHKHEDKHKIKHKKSLKKSPLKEKNNSNQKNVDNNENKEIKAEIIKIVEEKKDEVINKEEQKQQEQQIQTPQNNQNCFQRFCSSIKNILSCSCMRRKQVQEKKENANVLQQEQGCVDLQKQDLYLVENNAQQNGAAQNLKMNNRDENNIYSHQQLVPNEIEKVVQFEHNNEHEIMHYKQDCNPNSFQLKKKSSSVSLDKVDLNQDIIESNSIEREWPTDNYPKRKKKIYKLVESLKKTIANPKSDYEDLQNEFDLMYKLHEKNKCDFKFIFRSRPDGEKLIKMMIENKTVYLGIDLISDIVRFFRNPYNGSDFQPNVKQSPYFNNFAQMTVEIKASNLMCFTKSEEGEVQTEKQPPPPKIMRQGSIFVTNNYNFQSSATQNQSQGGKKHERETKENISSNNSTLAFFLDSKYTHKWKGDSYFGPGSVKITVDTDIKKVILIQNQSAFSSASPNNLNSPSQKPMQGFPFNLQKKKSSEVTSALNNYSQINQNISKDSFISGIQQNKSKQPSKSQYFNPNLFHQVSADSYMQNNTPNNQQQQQMNNNNFNFNNQNLFMQNQTNITNLNNQSTQPTQQNANNQSQNNVFQPATSITFQNQNYQSQYQSYLQNQTQTIVENIKLVFETTYELDFVRNKDQQQRNVIIQTNGQSNTKDKLAQQKQFDLNEHSYRRTNISVTNNKKNKNEHQASVTTLVKLQKVIKSMMQPTSTPLSIPYIPVQSTVPMSPFFDYNVQILTLKVEKFHFEILKNNFGVKILALKFDNLYAKKIQKLNNSLFGLKGAISIDYFNKRRITYEPLLEPWIFMVRQERIGNSHNLTIQNFESKKDQNMLPLLKEHHNSFNLNVTLSCLETIMEAYRIYKGTMTDEEPYMIINKTGLPIEVKDSNKENSQPQELQNQQKTKWQGWKEVYALRMQKQKQVQKLNDNKALINLNILNNMHNASNSNNNSFFNVASQMINYNQNNLANQENANQGGNYDGTAPMSIFRKDQKNGEQNINGQIQEISDEEKERLSPLVMNSDNFQKYTTNPIHEGDEQQEFNNNMEENGRINTQGSQQPPQRNLKLVIKQVSDHSKDQNNNQGTQDSNNNLLNLQALDQQGKPLNSAHSIRQKNKSNSSQHLNFYNYNLNADDQNNQSVEDKNNDNKNLPPIMILEKFNSIKSDQQTKVNLSKSQMRKNSQEFKPNLLGVNNENQIEPQRIRKSTDAYLEAANQKNQKKGDLGNLLNIQQPNQQKQVSILNSPKQNLTSSINLNNQQKKSSENKKLGPSSLFNKSNLMQTLKMNNLLSSQKNRQYLFRQIKRIQLDHVGKILIPLKLDKNELFEKKKAQENTLLLKAKNQQLQKKKTQKDAKNQEKDFTLMKAFMSNLTSLQKNINKLGQELISTLLNKKVNESGKTYLLVDNKLNPQTGSKEITISSSVKFFNNLCRTIVIEFQTEVETGQQKQQNQFSLIEQNSFFEIPLDKLEVCAYVRLFPYLLDKDNQPIPYNQINGHYEFVLLSSLIKDKTSYNDYTVDEDDIISDILKDQIQGVNVEKGNRLIYKEDYEVNPHIEKADNDKSLKSPTKKLSQISKILENEQQRQIAHSDLIYFLVTCVKTKHSASYSLSEKEFAYETTLIINPIFKFINATVSNVNIIYGMNVPLKPIQSKLNQSKTKIEPKQIVPKDRLECTSCPSSEDLQIVISLNLYRQTKELKIFTKHEQKYKIDLRLENFMKKSIILYLDVVKLSEKSREIVLFCPYLILNNSGYKEIKIREFGLTTNIDSHQDEDEDNFFNRKDRNHNSIQGAGSSQKKRPSIFEINNNDAKIDSYMKPIKSQNKIENILDENGNPIQRSEKESKRHTISENEEEIQNLKQLRMFSTSKTMNKIQIGLCPKGRKDRDSANWSQPISLQAADGIFIIQDKKSDYRNQFEFGITIESAPGFWSRSKIICITPRYMIRNESSYDIILKQNKSNYKDVLKECCQLEGKYENSKVSVKTFYWSDYKLPQECIIQLLGQRLNEDTVQEFKNTTTNKFRIDKVGDIAVKIKFDQDVQQGGDEEIQYLKISTQLEDNIFIVTIMNEDKMNPPFFIENQTKHEIYYGQHIQETKNLWCLRRKKQEMRQISTQVLYPGEKKKFTWDEWVVENDHILGVEIENETVYYNIDKIKDYPPIKIRESADELNKKKAINKKFLYKKGKIRLKFKAVDQYTTKFIILDVFQQKMKVYDEKKEVSGEVINLKGANIEDVRDQQFLMIKGNQHFYFEAISEKEAKEWTEYLWRAILLTTPDLVQFKIEPMERTKVLCFYQVKYEDEMNQNNENKQGDMNNDKMLLENDEEDNQEQDKAQTTFIFKITNTVGISFIDNIPKEILQISFKNLNLIYSLSNEQEDKIRKNILDDIDNNPNFLNNNAPTPNQNSLIANTQIQNTLANNLQNNNTTNPMMKDNQMISVTQNQNQQSLINNEPEVNQRIFANQRALLSLQIDSIIINNQIENTQFPVILAPTKRKTGDPFFIISVLWKNHVQKNNQNKNKKNKLVSYIHQTSFYVDTIEIRIDDHILDTAISYFNQVRNIISIKNNSDSFTELRIFKFEDIEDRLSMALENQNGNNQILNYIKNLRVEPIDICFTFRSSPGHSLTASTKNIIGDFGLTLASIDQAKIKLSQLLMTHIFGSIKDIFTRITKHFSQQFMRQLYKLLGSFDFLGSPVSLIENLGTSVVDMLYQPFYALVKGKSGYKFGEKFAIGAVNLISSSISGVYKTINKIIGTIMKLLASFTLHKQYIHSRQIRLNRTIKNVKEGVIIGLKNFFIDLWQTLTGIFRRPVSEAKHGGILGFFLGLYQAAVSLVIRPTVAMYDLITTIIQGLQNTAQYEEHIMDTRSRPIRQFGDNKQLIPYEFKAAIGIDIIKRYKLKIFEHETILFFDELIIKKLKKKNIESQIILSDIRIVYVKKHSSIAYKKIMLHKIKKIKYDESSKKMKIKMHVPVKKVCVRQKFDIYLKYESKERAQLLLDQIIKYQSLQRIPQFEVKLD